jgi:acyl carrier protein phosphodiesterase
VNWLAHVFLSEPDIEFKLGNLLADVVRGPELTGMSAEFLRGVRRHKAIDSFTDSHPVVRRSRTRLGAEHRRFSGVLMDVFYDYILATQWHRYSTVSLDAFTGAFYADAKACPISLPPQAQVLIDRIILHDLLGQYRSPQGVEESLRRLSMRLSARWHRDFALEKSVSALLAQADELTGDFNEFFPELRAYLGR